MSDGCEKRTAHSWREMECKMSKQKEKIDALLDGKLKINQLIGQTIVAEAFAELVDHNEEDGFWILDFLILYELRFTCN